MAGKRRPTTRRAALLVGIMALALVGAGCSSDSTAGDPSPAESTTTHHRWPRLDDPGRADGRGDAGSGGRGSGAQPAGRLRRALRDHRTGRWPADHVRRSRAGRVEHEDIHRDGDPAIGAGRQAESRRPRIAVHRRGAQRGEHPHPAAAEHAQWLVQLQRDAGTQRIPGQDARGRMDAAGPARPRLQQPCVLPAR